MRCFIAYIVIAFSLVSCNQNNGIKTLNGYIVYILPDNIKFIETKKMPDASYEKHFASDNFKSGISFKPNCLIEKVIDTVRPDTLLDENPELKEFTTFMRKPLIFPAQLTVIDTTQMQGAERRKFKVLYRGRDVEFSYVPSSGIVIDLKRIQ